MAYSNSPENSTYKTVELDFTATSWPRFTSASIQRDPEIVNMYFDRNSNENQTREFVLVKRPGCEDSLISLNKSANGVTVNGTFQDTTTGYFYWSVDNKVYRYNGSTVTLIASMGGTAPTGQNSVGFCLFLTSTGTRYLCINNGSELWYHDVTTNVSTKVTDVDYPTPTSPHMVFLDGYLFVIKSNTGDIYNSDLDTPINWTAGNYITTEINSDYAVTLAKVKNYLVCFGSDGIEFFYDSGNPSGSPLSRNESYYQAVILQSSVCSVGDDLYFVANQSKQFSKVYRLSGNNLQEISPSWVNRFVGNPIYSNTTNTLVFTFSANGHSFIGINTFFDYVLVYDLIEGFWYKWTFGTTFNTVNNSIQGTGTLNGKTVLIQGGKANISYLDTNTFQDFSVNFTCSYTTQDVTADTFNWKTCHRIGLYCDYPSTGGVNSNATISWSDDDGNTFSTPRNVSVTTNNPYITQCGRFRTRNWRISYTDNYPFRMWGLSMDLNVGNI